MNRDRLLADAKAKALKLAEGYKAPEPVEIKPAGAGGRAALGARGRRPEAPGQGDAL